MKELLKKLIGNTICRIFGHRWKSFVTYRRTGVNEYVHGVKCANCGKIKYVHTTKVKP